MIALGSAPFMSSARARVSAARIRQSRARLYHDDGDVMGIDNPRTQSASLISVKNAPSAGAPTQYAEDAHMQHEERNLPGPHVTAHGVRASINPCAPTPAASPRGPGINMNNGHL